MNSELKLTASDYTQRHSSNLLTIRQINREDMAEALRRGWHDFIAKPMHGLFVTVIYVLIALFATVIGLGIDLLPLLFPLIAGFALLGPLAASGLYALSRRRERGEDYAWWHVFDVLTAPSRLGIAGMGIILALIFALWLYSAQAMYTLFMGDIAVSDPADLLSTVFTTSAGWQLILAGCGVGFLFSVAVFVISIVALPLLMDQRISLPQAIAVSLRAVAANVRVMALWYLMIAAFFTIGALPLLIGWAVAAPVLAHATWHLYRKVIVQ